MRMIEKYVANDGSEWKTVEDACNREHIIGMVNNAMALLPAIPEELNWEGYIQHESKMMEGCKRLLFNIANTEGILKWWIDKQKEKHGKTEPELIDCHPSWFGRMLDDSCRPLERAYSRLCCIDDNLKEWNQPYFTTHQSENKNICRNEG